MLIKLSQHRDAEGMLEEKGLQEEGVVGGEGIGELCPSPTRRCAISQRPHSPARPSQCGRWALGLLPTLAEALCSFIASPQVCLLGSS